MSETKKLTIAQILRKKTIERKEKLKKLEILKSRFINNREELNKYDGSIWCNRNDCLISLGVCLFRKLNISCYVDYSKCKKCEDNLDKYIEIFEALINNTKTT